MTTDEVAKSKAECAQLDEIYRHNAECDRLSAQINGARRAIVGAEDALDAINAEYHNAVSRLCEAVDKNRDPHDKTTFGNAERA